tara:strand:- start:1232 stop:1423 length:192 start_codon:yes stop_codon:yes gene_type:complete
MQNVHPNQIDLMQVVVVLVMLVERLQAKCKNSKQKKTNKNKQNLKKKNRICKKKNKSQWLCPL